MIVDVILSSHLTVGRNVDPGIHLIEDCFLSAARQDLRRLGAHGLHRLLVVLCRTSHGLGAVLKPVANIDEIRFGIRADRGCQNSHRIFP